MRGIIGYEIQLQASSFIYSGKKIGSLQKCKKGCHLSGRTVSHQTSTPSLPPRALHPPHRPHRHRPTENMLLGLSIIIPPQKNSLCPEARVACVILAHQRLRQAVAGGSRQAGCSRRGSLPGRAYSPFTPCASSSSGPTAGWTCWRGSS